MRKGFATRNDVEFFLRPRLRALSDPFLLGNMDAAVTRILAALDRREKIVVFGDYDVDGVTSLALLWEMLRSYPGAAAPELFLPLRMEEGYGLSRESVERCIDQFAPQLLIAVDCGTSSAGEIADLKKRGVDVIVLDHHEPKSKLPGCIIVNPKTEQDSQFRYLCSVGIAFKVCHALLKKGPLPDFDLKSKLDLVALGTVADIVPLIGENRTFVQRGALEIARTSRIGLRRLMEASGVRPPILTEDIGFRLGPRLNAAGRLSSAEQSLRLLITTDEAEAEALAKSLDQQNRERQEVEQRIFLAADEQVAKDFDPARDAAIVVGAHEWHPGVLGIVASRLVRKYHRPTIVVGFDSSGLGKGSGRSIDSLSIVQALGCCAEFLEKYGGHEMAAGISIREDQFANFRGAFLQSVRELVSDEILEPRLRIDHELSFPELSYDFLQWHEMLQPFGNGNPQPVFYARAVEPAAEPRVLNDKHVSLRLRQRNYHQRAIFFDGAAEPLPSAPWDVAFRVRRGEYQGESRLEMHIQAVRTSVADY